MLLQNLIGANVELPENLKSLEIQSVSRDSRSAQKGDAFFCLTQNEQKAREFCKQAENTSVIFSNFDIPNAVRVPDTRSLFAHACANFYGRACDDMTMIGVTGTNGKTTTTHLIAQILNRNGHKAGLIGTNGVFYDGKRLDCPLTTPDADFLHRTFKEMKENGVDVVVMEVSAHAIDQKRVEGILFDVGVLTNITQDHLDYFHTLAEYEKIKLGFFTPDHMKQAVICSDDASACKLIENCQVPITTYGLNSPSDVFAIDTFCSMDGSHFVANVCDEVVEVRSNLIGKYNILNALAAMTVCHKLNVPEKDMAFDFATMLPVEGRFNVVNYTGRYVIIDYAHSPDGLKQVLSTARALTDKKLFCVFGCGGNRDKDKRHKMGEIAENLADVVCLTDDNPRFENSLDIIADIEKGMKKQHYVEPDRATAILKMLDLAEPEDAIVIAGKGAEKYQEVGDEKRPYNDFDVIYGHFKDTDPIKSRGKEW